jgi:alpha-galactosidase
MVAGVSCSLVPLGASRAAASTVLASYQGLASPASYNDAAQTPPMGFDDWYADWCKVTEQDILSNARALVSTGLAADGYDYVILDDCWMAKRRSATGQLRANPVRFPHGIAWLARHIHALGLKFGIYESAGRYTCEGFPGGLGHYEQDIRTFVSWHVDYIKLDLCGAPPGAHLEARFKQFSAELKAADPDIVFSEELPVNAATYHPYSAEFRRLVAVSSRISNMWRITPDEWPYQVPGQVLAGSLEADLPLAKYAGPTHWNDLDLLLTGNRGFGWSTAEQQAQLSIWAEMSSPLIVSADLASPPAVARWAPASNATVRMLANSAVIAVDQDPVQGHLAAADRRVDVVVKPMRGGGYAVLFVNTARSARTITIRLRAIGVRTGATWRNVWSDQSFTSGRSVTQHLAAFGAVLYELS